MGKDFGSLPAFCNYVSNAYCGHPLVMPYDSGWDDDPSGRYGGRIRVGEPDVFFVQTGIFQVNPTYPRDGNGFKLNFHGSPSRLATCRLPNPVPTLRPRKLPPLN
jgi:porin